jgi:invasion protein IalB
MRKAACAALLAMVAGGAAAQTQRPPTPAQPPAARAPAPAPAAQPEQRPAQLARSETTYFDNWQTTCQDFVNPQRRQCSALLQLLQTNQQNNTANVVLTWAMTQGEGQINAVLQTPTGVSIAPGIDMKFGRTARKIAYARCDTQRCEGDFAIDEALSKELSTAETAEVVITASQGNAVTFNIPLKGFDRAVQALRR